VRSQSKPELVGLALLAYVPFLLSSPGRVSADSKQYLYLDPGRFLARAGDLWDPQIAAGTVPHQHLGYLFPVGPWFWSLDRLGVPDWVAQRLWLGTLSLVAVLGARWLFRLLGAGPTGALVGALVYLLTPYQLAFTARLSVLLLPWAALPWLVGLTMRATRSGGWRQPALVALVLLGAGGINASSLLLVALGPALWLVLEAAGGRAAAARAAATAARIGVLAVGVSLWWVVGLRLQGSYGLPVLQLTENVRTVAEWSTPGDVLRGLGNWFFYGRDRTGFVLDQAAAYLDDRVVVAASFAVPTVALAAGIALRWRYRAFFGALIVVGTVVAVGAWPIDDPTPYGGAWEAFTSDTSIGLAFRNSPRAVPLVVLGLAGLAAAAVGAIPRPRAQQLAGGGLVVLALLALLPVARHGFLSAGLDRPEEIPEHWLEAVAAIDAGDHGTRVLEVPGASFAAYRWGNLVEPVTPGLTDRPYLAREVLPYGTAPSATLLDAFDRRLQQGTFEAATVAPIARLFAVGTVVLRADLDQSGRFDAPAPGPVWDVLTSEAAGLGPPRAFGPTDVDPDPEVPSVALFEVPEARPIVRVAPSEGPVVLAGDGDGIVDAAAAGLLDGRSLVLSAAALDDPSLEAALGAGAQLVLTDSNRRRIQTWFYSLRDTRGPTEQAGETQPDPTGYDFRLEPFPGRDDDSRTVVEQVGGRVSATMAGGPERPADRAAAAVDGDPATAWRVGGRDPRGERLVLEAPAPVPTNEVRLVRSAAKPGERVLTRVRVTVDDLAPIDVDLGPEADRPEGQAVTFAARDVTTVAVELLDTVPAPFSGGAEEPVGLAEVRLGDVRIDEVVRLPLDLLERSGSRAADPSLDVVLTRLRVELPETDLRDDEAHLDRRFELPTGRAFGLHGTVRRSGLASTPDPGDACREDLLEVDGDPVAVRLEPAAGAGAGSTWTLTGCGPLRLEAGSHRITAAEGRTTGLDLDRLVLSSTSSGAPADPGPRGTPASASGTEVVADRSGATSASIEVATDGEPFWLVLAQSESAGWAAATDGATVGERTLVDGYANGWLITPDGPGALTIDLTWEPQGLVWTGAAATVLAVLACAGILWRTRGRPTPPLAAEVALGERRGPAARSWAAVVVVALVVGATTALVAPPSVAGAAAGVTVAAGALRQGRLLLLVLAPAALVLSRLAPSRPSLAWLAVALLGAELLIDRWVRRSGPPDAPAAVSEG
jgi:arabinofuranan 3-O-arabinosyltransferase